MDVCVGDKVQIVNGGIDVTNGNKAKSGRMYGDGGPLWATVVLIDNNWKTGGRWGLPNTVVKVRCASDSGVIVWQVQPEDVCNVIRASQPETVQTEPTPSPPVIPTKTSIDPTFTNGWAKDEVGITRVTVRQEIVNSSNPFATQEGQVIWTDGIATGSETTGDTPTTLPVQTKVISGSSLGEKETVSYPNSTGTFRDFNDQERKSIGSNAVQVDQSAINGAVFSTVWENENKRKEILSEDSDNIQNAQGFPYKLYGSSNLATAKYDYQIIPGDPRYGSTVSLEDKLKEARASLGLPVHGSNAIARAMKYYMYNRFKVPDTNLAYNKTVTYVFFSRPDLNLLETCVNGGVPTANQQVLNHTEAAMVWRRYPELFKLLTASTRCGDNNDFNLLLSNQVSSFDIQDETLTTNDSGKSWNEYSVSYGDAYSGRTASEFSCNFVETSDLSVINLIKLWITYIDNVARGAWKPSYNKNVGDDSIAVDSDNDSYVYTKTLDYAASVYVFKCGPDGEEVLYWSKYYGVFPISTGANAMSWDSSQPIGDSLKLNVRFKYSMKRDNSPISLLEFNNLAKISGFAVSENSFNVNYGHSSRPFVGAPFIEISLQGPQIRNNGVKYDSPRTSIRLKFKKESDPQLTDEMLYRNSMAMRN